MVATTEAKGMNYIGGQWVAATGTSFEDRSPADTNQVLGVLPAPARAKRTPPYRPRVLPFPPGARSPASGGARYWMLSYNDSEYGFSLSVCSRDYRTIRTMREACEFGVGYVNLPTIGGEVHLPFGGIKKSGTGIPSAAGLQTAVTHQASWTVNHDREIKLAQGLTLE